MNKLNFETIKELFLKMNPNGDLYKDLIKKNTYNAVFTAGHKVYTYKVKNLLELAEKLKMETNTWMYNHVYEGKLNNIKRLENRLLELQIEKKEDNFFFDDMTIEEWQQHKEEEKQEINAEIRKIKNRLSEIEYLV